jgi:hypothetical protein
VRDGPRSGPFAPSSARTFVPAELQAVNIRR